MFLNNSYFNVLRKIDAGWEEKHHSPTARNKNKGWKKKLSRSWSQCSSPSHNYVSSISSAESGHYSEDANSGYYGDDEIEPCPQCRAANFPPVHRGPKLDIEDFDVISIEVNIKSPRDRTSKNELGNHCRHTELVNFDEFVVIPSSREEFCSGTFKQSTPVPNGNPFAEDNTDSATAISNTDILVTCTPKIVTCSSHGLSSKVVHSQSCTCFYSPQKPVRFRLDAPPRSSVTNGDIWWRENIVWQLRQRNQTQTQNFAQLNDNLGNNNTRTKVKINREVAHYLNRYGEFRPHNETLNTALVEMEPNALDKSDLLDAIRIHGSAVEVDGETSSSKVKGNTLAHLAREYMRKQSIVKIPALETDDEDITNQGAVHSRKRTRSRGVDARVRLFIPRWKESISNQLQMRNLLECKYFTDAIARRTMSQLSVSVSQGDSRSGQEFDDYDVINSDDATDVVSGKLITSIQSGSQGYHSYPTYTLENGYHKTPNNYVSKTKKVHCIQA